MVAVSVHMDVRRLNRTLRKVQRRQIPFAVSLAINKTLPIARQIIHDEWHRQLGKDGAKLKRGFPKQVLRWRRSTKVNLVGVLHAIAGEEVIRLQTKGGVKTAKGSALKIPASDAPKRSRKRPYRAGNYLFFLGRAPTSTRRSFRKACACRRRSDSNPRWRRYAGCSASNWKRR